MFDRSTITFIQATQDNNANVVDLLQTVKNTTEGDIL